jgi:anaerobic selenocysteine-containing dehydrogenase
VVAPVAERRPVWWMLAEVARRMGGDLLGGADPDSLTDELFLRGLMARSHLDADELFAAGGRGVDVAPEHGWVHDTMLPDGRWTIAPEVLVARLEARREHHDRPLVLAPRREMAWSNSVRYGRGDDAAVVRMHPDDAAGLASGDVVEVRSAHGSLVATVVIDGNVRRGVVSVTHNVEHTGPGRLTSAHDAVDALTGMPQASGVPVVVARR